MTTYSLYMFLVVVAIASYLQSLTGFALGIFALGGIIALNITSITTASMVINVLMVVNVAIALWGNLRYIDLRLLMLSHAGMIPGGVGGLWLLQHLSERDSDVLQLMLGLLIVVAGAAMAMRPQTKKEVSDLRYFLLSGILGGICGGMYSMPGPPVVYLFYRQPLTIQVVRCTLLAVFGLLSVLRLLVLAFQGEISGEVITLSIYTVPVAIVTSILCSYIPPKLPETIIRRGAFLLLTGMGVLIAATSIV